jgi:NADH-quinone oxidoreductase subunit H
LVATVIPIGSESFLGELNVGVLFVVGVTGLGTIGIFMGAWGSRNKYAVFGALRAVAMLISYEVPMALSITGIVITAGSLALLDIVAQQTIPYVLVQPLGFIIFMVCALAEMNRTPFDLVEGESELGGGYVTEFSGVKFAIFQLAEFMAPIVMSGLVTVLFLGGAKGLGPLPGIVWFFLKASTVLFFFLWIRATLPRLRVDQIMKLAWKALLPLALLNMFVVAIEVQILQDLKTGVLSVEDLWIMTGLNWTLSIIAIAVMSKLLVRRQFQKRDLVPSPLANMEGDAG